MKHIIAGAGPAGVVAAETLRKADAEAEILLLGGEPGPPYGRMAIPYVLAGDIDEAGATLRKTDGHYESLGIEIVRDRLAKVSADKKEVTLESGAEVAFDSLLIATGSAPLKPPVEGLDLPGVHHCWTLEDARDISALAGGGADVVLMGAGFIGCIILGSLISRGVKLTVVEMEDHMVSRMMNDTGGAMLKRWCESKGVTVLTGTQAVKVEKAGKKGLCVHLSNGDAVPAALVVVATGVGANTGFLEGSGVEIKDGIVVDDRMKTSVDGIYAAGDVAEGPDFCGGRSVHAVQPTAVDHGRVAALNMAGRDVRYRGSLAMNVLDTAGLVSTSFGNWRGVNGEDGGGDFAEALDEKKFRYIRLAFEDDRIVGSLTLGRTDHVGVLGGLIQTPVRLREWKEKLIADPHRIMEAYLARAAG